MHPVAAGEDRASALALAPDGWIVPGRGFRLAPGWPRTPLVAADAETGRALLDAAGGETFINVPAANVAALEAVRERGLAELHTARRMRLGPPVAWRPARVWGAISLFCG